MTFVSYAQNNEDVMLARVFRGLETGFYIDVGAQDPRIDSVTKAFYELGWHGINIEPVEFWYQKLCQDRPRDINLCLAAGATQAIVDFFEVADTGLSTSSADFAEGYRVQGREVIARKVQVRTLDEICTEHDVHAAHFLKIDAEGAEADVLRGIGLVRLRPWVILVEATEPNSVISTHAQWESLLIDRGYIHVYDDGLNRFYLASEHSALGAAFATPPNVHDDFVQRVLVDHRNHEQGLARHIAAIEDLAQLRVEAIERLDRIIVGKDQALADLQAQARASLSRLQEVLVERETSLSELRKDMAERETSYSALQDVLVEREASLFLLRDICARHEAELQAKQAKLANLSARLQSSDRSVADLSKSLIDSEASRLASDAGWAAALAENRRTLEELAKAQQDFQDVLSSRSWRLTSPLRRAMTLLVAIRGQVARLIRRLVPGAALHRPAAPDSKAAAVVAGAPDGGVSGEHPGDSIAVESPPLPPRVLPLSDDAEQILLRFPILDPAKINEDGN